MFDFLKIMDIKLISVISQLENDIKYKSGNILVTIQTFCELLMKNIEYEETGHKIKRKPLGQYLEDKSFSNILLNDLYIDTNTLDFINKKANQVKHDGIYNYEIEEIKRLVRFLFDISKNTICYYYEVDKKDIEYQEEYYDDLIKGLELDKEKIKEHYANQANEKIEEYKNALNTALIQKEQLEKRIKKTEEEKDLFKEQISKIDNLETQLRIKDDKINELRINKAKLEEELNEKAIDEKKKLEEQIKELKAESFSLKDKIRELREKDIKDPEIMIDRDSKILEEKNKEIKELKALIANQEMVNNEKLFQLYRKNALRLGFSSSYAEDDSYFIVTGVSEKVISTSRYKSFYAVLNNLLQRGNLIKQSKYLKEKNLLDDELKVIYRLELTILSLIRNNKLKDNYWNINYINGDIKLLNIACEDIMYWLDLITSISKETYEHPNLNLKVDKVSDDYLNIKYDNKNTYDNVYNIMDCIKIEEEDNDDFFSIWIDDYIKYNVSKNKLNKMEEILEELFDFKQFNAGQYEILEHTLNGNNTIGILPTGGGKSLIYQFASLLEPKITLVVDPINSLIKDQIEGLAKKYGITRCLNLTSSNENRKIDEVKLRKGNALFVFTSPERFQNDTFRKILMGLSEKKSVERIILDEVHCLSEWGHEFRIPYLMLAHTLNTYCGKQIKYLGLTATASASVINDLIVELKMNTTDVIFLKKLRRKNLSFKFINYNDESQMKEALFEQIDKVNPKLNKGETNSIIIFSRTIEGKSFTSINNIDKLIRPIYGRLLEKYYGGLDLRTKENAQEGFINNEKSILIATKAFGMGIDKPNIRSTIHYGVPSSFEAFYQEAGRAGRDKNPAECLIYTYKYSEEDKRNIKEIFNGNKTVEEMQIISNKLKKTDLNTNLYFLLNDLMSPEEEAKRVFELYKYLYKNSNMNQIIISDNKKFEKEKLLYILHKLGIVNNWEKDYISHTLTVHLSTHFNDISYIKSSAIKYISQYKEFKETREKIEKITSLNYLETLILEVRKWYFNNFVLGKKNQLYNMISKIEEFANKDCSDQIQEQIDSYFDLTNIISETEEGYALKFDNESYSEIISYVAELEEHKIDKRKIEMERILESVTTLNISLYMSLLLLKKGDFDSANGKQRFENVYNESDDAGKVEIMASLAETLYSSLSIEQQKILLNTLFKLDYIRMRSVFLEHVKEDSINRKYWLSYINDRLEKINIGG